MESIRELHGVIQVAMGWEGIHLYGFHLRAARYGSWEVSASSPDVTLAALRFRKGARFVYEYDLNIPWRHEVRIEDRLEPEAGKTYPLCTDGGGACPPEDCGGPESFMAARDNRFSFDALEDWTPWPRFFSKLCWRIDRLLDDRNTRSQQGDARAPPRDLLANRRVVPQIITAFRAIPEVRSEPTSGARVLIFS